MFIKGIIKKGSYFDSVSLMLVAKEINTMQGIIDSAVVMATPENKAILKAAGLLLDEFQNCNDTDLVVAVKGENMQDIENAINQIDQIFKNIKNKNKQGSSFIPKSLDGALQQLPDANVCLISVAGKYAAQEAMKALKKGLHVMLFSDNVSIEDELKLKQFAISKGLLLMGPDCGTAIINGVPLAFANNVNRGNIGIVAASGTGLQEVSCVISNLGAGISQAIGTGGRDVKKDIGGLMFLEALKALNEDVSTKIIVLVSKPPHDTVLQKIATNLKTIHKPVIAIFIGGNASILKEAGAIPASNLFEAGALAAQLSEGIDLKNIDSKQIIDYSNIAQKAKSININTKGKYLRGLFSGGTLCDEAQLIFSNYMNEIYSNTPLNPAFKLKNVWKSEKNTIIDLGDDEFTVGRPHPMIDYSLRCKKIIDEASDPEVAIILLDVVLGYGSHPNPATELQPAIQRAYTLNPTIKIVCSITGTDKDFQNKALQKQILENNNVFVLNSNAEACVFAGTMYQQILSQKK